MFAGILYFALPMTRSMITDDPEPPAQQRRAESMQSEIIPVGGFNETPIAAARPVPVVVTLTISSRCQLRVVADGNEILGRTMEQGETLPIELGVRAAAAWRQCGGGAVQHQRPGRAPARSSLATSCRPASAATITRIFWFDTDGVGSGHADAGFFPAR